MSKDVSRSKWVKGHAPSIQVNTFILPQNHATKPIGFPNSNKCKLEVRLFTVMVTDPGLNAPAFNATYL